MDKYCFWTGLPTMKRHALMMNNPKKARELKIAEANARGDRALAAKWGVLDDFDDGFPDLDRYQAKRWEELDMVTKARLYRENKIVYVGLKNNWLSRMGRAHERVQAPE